MANKNKLQTLYIGTSGWSYKHWAGIFYPEHIKSDKYLEYYLTNFDCVELNSCFYHLPKKPTIKGWINRTPDFFRFCPKLSRFITHQKRLNDVEEPLKKFFVLFEEMKSRLGPILIQLPPGLHFNRSSAHDFLHILKREYNSYRFAVEVRHTSWISDDFFNLLAQHDLAFVIADSGGRFPYHEEVTTDFVYLRFHGPKKLYASDYSDHELDSFAKKIKGWLGDDKEVWAFFNNDFNGYAIKNSNRLREMIRSMSN